MAAGLPPDSPLAIRASTRALPVRARYVLRVEAGARVAAIPSAPRVAGAAGAAAPPPPPPPGGAGVGGRGGTARRVTGRTTPSAGTPSARWRAMTVEPPAPALSAERVP